MNVKATDGCSEKFPVLSDFVLSEIDQSFIFPILKLSYQRDRIKFWVNKCDAKEYKYELETQFLIK